MMSYVINKWKRSYFLGTILFARVSSPTSVAEVAISHTKF